MGGAGTCRASGAGVALRGNAGGAGMRSAPAKPDAKKSTERARAVGAEGDGGVRERPAESRSPVATPRPHSVQREIGLVVVALFALSRRFVEALAAQFVG